MRLDQSGHILAGIAPAPSHAGEIPIQTKLGRRMQQHNADRPSGEVVGLHRLPRSRKSALQPAGALEGETPAQITWRPACHIHAETAPTLEAPPPLRELIVMQLRVDSPPRIRILRPRKAPSSQSGFESVATHRKNRCYPRSICMPALMTLSVLPELSDRSGDGGCHRPR